MVVLVSIVAASTLVTAWDPVATMLCCEDLFAEDEEEVRVAASDDGAC